MRSPENRRKRIGRLLTSVEVYRSATGMYIVSPMREILAILHPDKASLIRVIDTYKGPRYCVDVPNTDPNGNRG